MLSRVACVPRVCLSCRLGILQARAALGGPSLFPQDRWIRRRHDGRDIVHSKARIEALISGKLVESPETTGAGEPKSGKKSKKGSKRKRPKGQSKDKDLGRDDNDDFPDWGFSFPTFEKRGGQRAEIGQQEKRARAPWLPPSSSPSQSAIGEDAEDTTSALEGGEEEEEELQDKSRETAFSIEQEARRQLLLEDEAMEDEEPIETTAPPGTIAGSEQPDKAQRPAVSPRKQAEPKQRARPKTRRHVVLGGGLVRAATVGKEALGKPLDALIVKNPNLLRWPRKPVRELAPEKLAETDLDWHEFVPKEEGPSDLMDEAVRNLDALRPADAAPLSMRDFDDLQEQLVGGFTYNQLTSYFYRQLRQMDMTKKQLVESLKKEAVKYDWVIEQTNWEPNEPDHWVKSTPKVNFALLIMQALWRIEVREQVEGLGRMQLWLQPDVFKLISAPSNSALRALATQYLYSPNNERIESSVDESRVDIIARKSIVPVFLSRLDEVVGSITSQVVSTEDLDAADLAPGRLQEVARITSSLIEYNGETAELNITWVADRLAAPQSSKTDDAPAQTETPPDIVLRLLTKHQEGPPLTLQVMSPSQQDTPSYRLLPHHRERRSMSWRERLQSWCRYVSPIGRQPAEDAAQPAAPPVESIGLISLPKKPSKPAHPDAAEVFTATFGHILHKAQAEQEQEQEQGQDPGTADDAAEQHAVLRNRPRILSPVVPHPAALTPLTADAAEPITQQTSIVLHFTPSPSQPPSAKFRVNESTPSLRLALPIDTDDDLSNLAPPADTTLHAVIPRFAHDVLCPRSAVDVRLAQDALVPLAPAEQPLSQLLAACDFDLAEGRLDAPALATFSVPAAWLSTPAGRPSRSKKPALVRYRFAGLELRQAVEAAWRGHTLVYTSTEAGEHAGQRQELSLRFGQLPGQGHNAAAAPDERERAGFLALVEEVARGEHFSWHEGYKEVRKTAAAGSELIDGDGEVVEEVDTYEPESAVDEGSDFSSLDTRTGTDFEDVVDMYEPEGAVDEGFDFSFLEAETGTDVEDVGAAAAEEGGTEEPIRNEDESTQAVDPVESSPTGSSVPETPVPETSSGSEDELDGAASPALHGKIE